MFGGSWMTIQRDALIDELKRVSEVVGRSPTEADMLEYGEFAYSTYFRYFESWTKAKTIAGVADESENRISDEELITELKRIASVIDGSPTRRQVDRMGEYPSSTYKYRFGTWNDALRAADLSINQSANREESPLWYGPNWEARRRKALERDGYECQLCARGPADVSHSLHIHHITPLRKFQNTQTETDFEEANALENLVTLCPACHKMYEGQYQNHKPKEFVRVIENE